MERRSGEDIVNSLRSRLGLRAAPKPPPVTACTPDRLPPAAPAAPKAAAAGADRVQKAADRAEVATLRKELWRPGQARPAGDVSRREAAAEGGGPACREIQILAAARDP